MLKLNTASFWVGKWEYDHSSSSFWRPEKRFLLYLTNSISLTTLKRSMVGSYKFKHITYEPAIPFIGIYSVQFSSVQSLSRVRLFVSPRTAARQASLSITNSGVYSNSCPLSRWCHPTISSSVVPFSSRLQSFPASGSFQMSQLFASGGQSIGASASTSVLPMNTQDRSPYSR